MKMGVFKPDSGVQSLAVLGRWNTHGVVSTMPASMPSFAKFSSRLTQFDTLQKLIFTDFRSIESLNFG
jgi:hypothetical protein